MTGPDTLAPMYGPELSEVIKFENTYLLLIDFDGTQAETFDPSPAGVGVEENYENTLGEIFNNDVLVSYQEVGLNNRSPGEVIESLVDQFGETIFDEAYAYQHKNYDWLAGVMPDTIENMDCWDEDPMRATLETYVRADLLNSLGHIGLRFEDGSVWPRQTPGYGDFLKAVEYVNAQAGVKIQIGVITAGYSEYIQKVYDTWGVTSPDIWVTDDRTRALGQTIAPERRMKPSPLVMALAHQDWLHQNGIRLDGWSEESPMDKVVDSKKRMFYFGDGIVRDNELAQRSKVGFGHYSDQATDPEYEDSLMRFGNWQLIAQRLVEGVERMKTGEQIDAIIRGE